MRNDNSPHKSMLMYRIVCKNIQKLELLPPETDHLIKGWKVNIIKDPKSTILKEKFLSKYEPIYVYYLNQWFIRGSLKSVVDRFLNSVIQTYGQGKSQPPHKGAPKKKKTSFKLNTKPSNVFKNLRFSYKWSWQVDITVYPILHGDLFSLWSYTSQSIDSFQELYEKECHRQNG